MTTYGINAVKLDTQGHVEIATIRQWDAANKRWIGRRINQPVQALVSLLKAGDTIYSIFRIDRAITPGPGFRRVTLADGRETIALPDNPEGLTLQQLAVCYL